MAYIVTTPPGPWCITNAEIAYWPCGGGHRPPCPSNRPATSVPTTIAGQRLYAWQIELLKNYMNEELQRYRQHPSYANQPTITATFEAGTPIDETEWQNVYWAFFGIGNAPGDNSTLSNVYWTQMIDQYNVVRQNCICNSDCGCNTVCTCNINCLCHYD